MPTGLRWLTMSLAIVLAPLMAFQPAADKNSEYQLKAAFLYNFIQYIEWGGAGGGGEGYVIGILGDSPIDDPLTEISKNGNKKITVKHFRSPGDITYCHILFISKNAPYGADAILSKVGRGTLTVGEKDGLARQGIAINFVIVDNKLKFESNLKAISDAGLKASSQLLKLAIIVG
jgi:hypothetical protein